ncbi:MAG: type II secretion system protein [bacterium]
MLFQRGEHGFTLIELLIVVAIIAILAAIAIPNFLAAQTRSKVSRTRADLRTISTGLESYNVDNTIYPDMMDDKDLYGTNDFRVPNSLTTPVSYFSNNKMVDPFYQSGITDQESNATGGSIAGKVYFTYSNLVQWKKDGYLPAFTNPGREAYGDWRLISVGPDGCYYNQGPAPNFPAKRWKHVIEYDPTNGIRSMGNIFRSQKHGEPYEWRGPEASYWTGD